MDSDNDYSNPHSKNNYKKHEQIDNNITTDMCGNKNNNNRNSNKNIDHNKHDNNNNNSNS